MVEVTKLSWSAIGDLALAVAQKVLDCVPHNPVIALHPIPRGGIFAALSVQSAIRQLQPSRKVTIVSEPSSAVVAIDDIVDSGKTRERFVEQHNIPFFALFNKNGSRKWVQFPWEVENEQGGAEDNVRRLIERIGDDPNREGLVETPKRVIASYDTLFGGYQQKPEDVIKVFKDERCDQMVLLRNVEFYSTCEHHMLPFFGKAHIAYLPNDWVIGVSKLARLLEVFSRRLQIQERICRQITQALNQLLQPRGTACILSAQHFCMTSRGVQKQDSEMVTSSLTGEFLTNHIARAELLNLINTK